MKKQRIQPLVALQAIRELIKDPERTEQVFVIIRALAGNSNEKTFQRFIKTPVGKSVLTEQRNLLETLQNRAYLASLPVGSLGREYLNFMTEGDITAEGLVDASAAEEAQFEDEDRERFGLRMRDQHDLWHVVTGYGRDTLGEACVLGFSYAQTKNRGLGFIAVVGAFQIAKELCPEVRTAVWTAYKNGKRAAWLPAVDWEAALSRPLSELRTELGITEPHRYNAIFEAHILQPAG